MDDLYRIIIVLHILCWALVIGGWLTHLRSSEPVKGLWHAAAGALATGIILVGIASGSDAVADPNNTKIAFKLILALAVFAAAFMAERRRDSVAQLTAIAGSLAIVNVGIAVLWT